MSSDVTTIWPYIYIYIGEYRPKKVHMQYPRIQIHTNTVDGRNPKQPPGMVKTL